MATWTVETLNRTVDREIASLPSDVRAKVFNTVDLLEANGPHAVGMPRVRPLGNKLFEIRAKGRDTIGRAIYVAAHHRRLVILVAFVKKTQKTPARFIKLAQQRTKEIE